MIIMMIKHPHRLNTISLYNEDLNRLRRMATGIMATEIKMEETTESIQRWETLNKYNYSNSEIYQKPTSLMNQSITQATVAW